MGSNAVNDSIGTWSSFARCDRVRAMPEACGPMIATVSPSKYCNPVLTKLISYSFLLKFMQSTDTCITNKNSGFLETCSKTPI